MPPQCLGFSRRAGIELSSRPLPTPPWSPSSFPIKLPLGARCCSGWGFSIKHGPCSPEQVYALIRSLGWGVDWDTTGDRDSPPLQQFSKAAMEQWVPGVSPPVEKEEAGMEPAMGAPDWRLSVGGGAWYADHSTCVMVPHGPSCYSVLSLSLRSFTSGPAAGGSQGLAPGGRHQPWAATRKPGPSPQDTARILAPGPRAGDDTN